MLVLTRKENQSIVIGEDIEIKVIAVEGEQIKLGIEAPKHIEVHRKEIFLSIQDENKQASTVKVDKGMLQQLSTKLKKVEKKY